MFLLPVYWNIYAEIREDLHVNHLWELRGLSSQKTDI